MGDHLCGPRRDAFTKASYPRSLAPARARSRRPAASRTKPIDEDIPPGSGVDDALGGLSGADDGRTQQATRKLSEGAVPFRTSWMSPFERIWRGSRANAQGAPEAVQISGRARSSVRAAVGRFRQKLNQVGLDLPTLRRFGPTLPRIPPKMAECGLCGGVWPNLVELRDLGSLANLVPPPNNFWASFCATCSVPRSRSVCLSNVQVHAKQLSDIVRVTSDELCFPTVFSAQNGNFG